MALEIPISIAKSGSTSKTYVLSEADLGKGFKLNVKPGEAAIQVPIFKRTFDDPKATFKDVERVQLDQHFNETRTIDSVEDIKDTMEISGHLSVAYGPMISGEGGGEYLKDKLSSSRSSSFTYTAIHKVEARRLLDATYKTGADGTAEKIFNGTATDPEIAAFQDRYGTYFVYEIIYGAKLEMTFSMISDKDVDMEKIMAELKGSVGVGLVKVGFEARFEKFMEETNSKIELNITARAIGAPMLLPPNPTLQQANDLVEKWNKSFEDKITDDELSPIAFSVISIASKTPHVDATTASVLDMKMAKLARVMQAAIFWSQQLSAARERAQDLYEKSPKLNKLLYVPFANAIEGPAKQKLEDKIKECMDYRGLSLAQILETEPPKYERGEDPGMNDEILALSGKVYRKQPEGEFEGYMLDGKIFMSGKYTFADGKEYRGDWRFQKFHGKGILTYANGNVYAGEFLEGKRDGKGTYTRVDGSVYKGEFHKDKKQGTGKYSWADGDVYEGKWLADKLHYRGVFTWADGDVYKGEYREGSKHGTGTYTYADGTVYEGRYRDGLKHGTGTETWKSGQVYEGQWKDGKKHGTGKIKYDSGNVYEGQFQEGRRHGTATYTYVNGDGYQGQYQDGHAHGTGTYTWADGDVYEGEYREGKRHGKGKMSYPGGDVYEGQWKDNNKHGTGKYTSTSGWVYEGEFRDAERHGKGIKTSPSGKTETVEYRNGKLL